MKKIKLDLSETTRYRLKFFSTIVFAVACIGIIIHIIDNIFLRRATNKAAITNVAVVKASPTAKAEVIVLPGNVQAWHEATIFARTNGYISHWDADIGSIVKSGQLLAEIDSPELNAQLRQAQADLKTAEANNNLAQTTAKRWAVLLKTDSVSKQEADEKQSDALAKNALVNSARANRDRLLELVGFEKIIAPFDGVITSRTTDIGALITAGSTNQVPLFRISQADKLRIYVNIPQNYSTRITPGMRVYLTFAEHPGKTYAATLFETAKAIDPVSRTLLAQFVYDNKNNEILPGGYTQVHLEFPAVKNSTRFPVNTLLFRAQGLEIATLDKDNNVVLKPIKISRDFGDEVEVDSGIKPGELLIINPPDAIYTGQHVRVVNDSSKDPAS